jgi:hypothetical protein
VVLQVWPLEVRSPCRQTCIWYNTLQDLCKASLNGYIYATRHNSYTAVLHTIGLKLMQQAKQCQKEETWNGANEL